MTGNNTDYRTKGRAVFLAALMVLSMVAVPMAFAGSVAAADDVTNASADDVDAGSSADNQTVEFEVTLASDEEDTIIVDLSNAADAGAVPHAADVTSDNTTGVVVDDFEIDGDNLEIELAENASTTSTATITAEVTHDLSDVAPANGVTVNVNDSDDSDSSSTTFDVSGVDIDSENRAYAGQYVQSTNASSGDDIELIKDLGDDDEEFIDVETAGDNGFVSFDTDDLESGEDYSLVNTDDGDSVSAEFSLSTPRLDAEFDDDSVDNQGDTNTTVELDANRPSYSVHVTADGLDNDDLSDIFGSNADAYQTSDGVVLSDIGDGEFDADFEDIDADDYEFEFDMTDTIVEDTSSITVDEGEDADVEFVEDTVEVTQGDTAEFEVEIIGGAEQGTLVIGNFDNDGYQAVVNITDIDDDSDTVTVEFNTYTAGNTSYDIVTSDDAEVELNQNATSDVTDRQELSSILDAGDYDVYLSGSMIENANEDNVDDFVDDADEIGGLFVDERTAGDMNLWTASSDNAEDIEDVDDVTDAAEDGTLTETDTVAFGDALVHQIELDGIGGFLAATDEDDLDEMLEAALTAGVVDLEIIETDESAGANQDPTALEDDQLDADDFEVIYEGGELYVVFTELPTDGSVWEDGTPEDGDEFTVDLVVSDERLLQVGDDMPLTSADEDDYEDDYLVIGSEFSVEDRDASFDTEEVDDEDVVAVLAEEDQNVTGTTNIAPGSELDIRLAGQDDARFRTTESDLVVQPDGTFSGTFDFSDREAGDEFTADIRGADLAESAETDGVVVEAAAPAAFEVSGLDPADVSVEQGDVIEVSATIENTGEEEATQDVTFQVDGNELGSEEVTLDGGEDTTVTFSDIDTSDLEPGDYEHGVFTDDSEQTATLTVEEVSEDDGETDDGETDDGETDDGETDDGETDDGDDDGETDDEGGVPGFGVIVALIALIGAAMLAARRQN